jgi:hypothetical protein
MIGNIAVKVGSWSDDDDDDDDDDDADGFALVALLQLLRRLL